MYYILSIYILHKLNKTISMYNFSYNLFIRDNFCAIYYFFESKFDVITLKKRGFQTSWGTENAASTLFHGENIKVISIKSMKHKQTQHSWKKTTMLLWRISKHDFFPFSQDDLTITSILIQIKSSRKVKVVCHMFLLLLSPSPKSRSTNAFSTWSPISRSRTSTSWSGTDQIWIHQ